MNALPKLRTQGIGDIAGPMRNALAMENMRQQNQLNAARLAALPTEAERAATKEDAAKLQNLTLEEKNLRLLQSKFQQARDYLPSVTKRNYADWAKWTGGITGAAPERFASPEEVQAMSDVEFEDHKLKLAMKADDFIKMTVADVKRNHRKPGELRTIERGGNKVTEEWTGSEWKQKGTSPKWDPDRKKPAKGTTRSFQKGSETVTEEWDGDKWVEKSAGPKWDPDKGTKGKGPTEKEARAKLHAIAKYREQLKTSGGMNSDLFKLMPADKAKELLGIDRSEIEAKLAEYESYLKGFITKGPKEPSWRDYR